MMRAVHDDEKSMHIGLDGEKMTHRVQDMIVATDAGLFFAFCDLRPEREEQNPDAGQPHEDTPA